MSIEHVDNYSDEVSLVCDGDNCTVGLDFPSFKAAVAFKKREKLKPNGWRSYKEGMTWKDSCPACSEKYRNSFRD